MFDISFAEIALVIICAIIFIRPSDMPVVLRTCAKAFAYLKKLMREFKELFDEVVQESGMKDIQREVEREVTLITGDDGKKYESYDIGDFVPKDKP